MAASSSSPFGVQVGLDSPLRQLTIGVSRDDCGDIARSVQLCPQGERVKEQMEGQIYLLSSQIYAIQCYAGEVVKFTKIREGKNAPDTELSSIT